MDGLLDDVLQHVFEFAADFGQGGADAVAGFAAGAGLQLLSGTADGEALVVQQMANLAHQHDVTLLVVAPVAAPLDRAQLREFLLPVAQHMRLDGTEVADLADGEVTLLQADYQSYTQG